MRRLVLAAALGLTIAATGVAAQTKTTSTMQLDSDHSNVTAAVSGAKSRFGIVAGALEYDPAKPEQSTIALSLDTTSLEDQGVRTAFDADRFPELRIASTAVGKKSSAGAEVLVTDVTIRDITRPVVFQVTFRTVSPGVINFHAEGTVRSADFHLMGRGEVPIVIDAPFDRVQATRALP